MKVYCIFDISIACAFPIPGLTVLEQATPDWVIDLATASLCTKETEWFYSWQGPDGEQIMACAYHDNGYLLKFNGMACFLIDFESQHISAFPECECPENTLAHLLIDQVIPRALGHQGRMVIHASAVGFNGNHAVAFTGESGQGKSTLATAFVTAGHGLVTDDCLLLENRNGVVYAMASYPSLRLWPDSAETMIEQGGIKGARISEVAHYSYKKQVFLNSSDMSERPSWVELDRLYLLESNAMGTNAGPAKESSIRITNAGGMASIMALIESMFALDVVSEQSVRRNFEVVQRVAKGVAVKRLVYPHDYAALPGVLAAVTDDIAD